MRMKSRGRWLAWCVVALQTAVWASAAQPTPGLQNLRCEAETNPLAVADARPTFTWVYGPGADANTIETAARVIVAEASSATHTVWDSGWKPDTTLSLRYGGPALQAGTEYTWRVETRNRDGSIAHSQTAHFRTAEAAWKAHWIEAPWSTERDGAEADGSRPMPVFRRGFTLRAKPVEAILRIVGLGQWQARIGSDGHVNLAQPRGLHGAWTDYRKTVDYDTVDVTSMLAQGPAAISVLLGNGMYNVQRTHLPGKAHERYTKFAGSFGPPKLLAELRIRYADGTTQLIATDGSWRVARGPVVFDSTYGGEDFDARREAEGWDLAGFNDSSWSEAKTTDGPGGKLIPTLAPPVGEHHVYEPISQTDVGHGRVVFDLGQNFAGVVRIHVQGPAGAVLRLIPGELLNADGTVSQATFHGPMWWSYTLRGDAQGETWQPLFDYMGFRYVQAEWTPGPGSAAASLSTPPPPGQLLSLVGVEEHSDSPDVGSFRTSAPMLSAIHSLIVHSMHNNEVSLFTDCPQREKLGWLEQDHLVAQSLMFNNDLERLYRETDRNITDAQLPDGLVPTIAPQYTKFGPKYPIYDESPEWGSSAVLAPFWAYRFYGNTAELERMYPVMKAYVAALQSKAKDGIVAYGLGDWYDIGPGGPGFEKNTSLGVTATMMLLEDAQTMQKIATLLGHADDAAHYSTLAQATIEAFNRHFWDAQHGWYDRGSQAAQAMPLALGAVPEAHRAEVLAHLIADIHAHQDHVTAGEVGYPYLLRALSQSGYNDVILAILLRKDPPSYGSQLVAGATSLTEAWDANPHNSQDHFMLGSADAWFYNTLGGIDVDMSRSNPAQRITIKPDALANIDWVRTRFAARVGTVESDWRHEGDKVHYTVIIPGGVLATVVLPSAARPDQHGAHEVHRDHMHRRFELGPGTWNFTAGAH